MIFELDETLEWHPTVHREWNSYLRKHTVTSEDLLEVLRGKGNCRSIGSDDCKEFKALRNQLEEQGYIQCSRQSWNGDIVLKTFFLNGVRFDADDRFFSGAAMKYHLQSARRYELHNNQT